MSTGDSKVNQLSAALRVARRTRGLSIAALAARAGVSPRLVSEFELGKRPHVSLETALRLLELVGLSPSVADAPRMSDEARAERAQRRRATWTGEKSTIGALGAPSAPASHATRLAAVAQASRLAVGLQAAHRAAMEREAAKPPTR